MVSDSFMVRRPGDVSPLPLRAHAGSEVGHGHVSSPCIPERENVIEEQGLFWSQFLGKPQMDFA